MRLAAIRPDEPERLSALDEYDALRPDLDPRLDEIVSLARRLFAVPIALISLVAADNQVFAARDGIEVCETGRDISFCSHALGRDDGLIVPDARLDPRFADNPLVTGAPHVRFYAGVPLRSPGGYDIGTLCIIDTHPRATFSAADRRALRDLARLAMDQFEVRRIRVAGNVSQNRFLNIASTSPDAIVCADHCGHIRFWNETAERLFGYEATEALGAPIDIIVPEGMRLGHAAGLKRVAEGGAPLLVGRTIELDAQHKDGHIFPIELSLSMWHEGGTASFGAIMRDISERRRNEARLHQLAHSDWLTGLPNRSVILARLAEEIEAKRGFHLLMLDLDSFKEVNDTLGHVVGDAVLTDVARRALACVDPSATVARLGGDEFAVLLPAADRVRTQETADRLIAALEAPFICADQLVHVSASVGVAAFPGDGATAEELLSSVDLALYQAKREGRGCSRFFSAALRETALARRAFESELRRAVEQEEFELFYQPQVALADGRLLGAEALLRWRHPTRGLLLPAAFLGALEAGMLSHRVGGWVLETACAQAAAWCRRLPGFRMGVNLFESQFRGGDLGRRVRAVLARSGLPASALELEVTENVVLRHDATMRDALRELHDLGVGVAFDDFGTGFASLTMLKTYPLTRLKIDRSFVQHICEDPADAVIVSAVAALGRGLGLEVIAEGTETPAQCEMLRASGCTSAQGYLFGRPMPAAEFEATMLAGPRPVRERRSA